MASAVLLGSNFECPMPSLFTAERNSQQGEDFQHQGYVVLWGFSGNEKVGSLVATSLLHRQVEHLFHA